MTVIEEDTALAEELAAAAPMRWWNRTTVALSAIVLLVGGFVGGLEVQQRWGSTEAAAETPTRGPGRYFAGAPTTTTAATGTTGTVKLVNGTTIYVETENGEVVTVKTDGKTTVATASKGKLADVKAGQSITVQGATGTDGIVTATSVTARK